MSDNEVRQMFLVPPAPGLCQECAVDHEAREPHDRNSLYYQMKFMAEHARREPTWADAIAHCSPEIQAAWKAELIAVGAWDGDDQ